MHIKCRSEARWVGWSRSLTTPSLFRDALDALPRNFTNIQSLSLSLSLSIRKTYWFFYNTFQTTNICTDDNFFDTLNNGWLIIIWWLVRGTSGFVHLFLKTTPYKNIHPHVHLLFCFVMTKHFSMFSYVIIILMTILSLHYRYFDFWGWNI